MKKETLKTEKEKLEKLEAPANNKAIDKDCNEADGNVFNRTSKNTLKTLFGDNGNYNKDGRQDKMVEDFRGALRQYRLARKDNNTDAMKLWGERALKIADCFSDDTKAAFGKEIGYIKADKGSGEDWSRRAKADLGV